MSLLSMQDVSEILAKGCSLTPIGEFTYLRTYSRKLASEQRREKWEETVLRFVNYSMKLYIDHMLKLKLPYDLEALKKEALELFDSVYSTKQFPSGRSLWVGGTEIAEEYPLSNFNCSFTHVKRYEDLCQLFYVLLLGTGVGCKHELNNDCIEPLRNDIEVVHAKYKPRAKAERQEKSTIKIRGNVATIHVGDSKEGWVDGLRKFFEVHSDNAYEHVTKIKMVYNSIRPMGEELKRFGGTASGHGSILQMFTNISRVIKNQVDEGLEPLEVVNGRYVKLRPIHILDIANFIGNNVVIGGVRRTAEIFLFSTNDFETLFAKYGINGIWTEEQREHHFKIMEMCENLGIKVPKRVTDIGTAPLGVMPEGLHHRRMSNNSVAFKEKPSQELMELFVAMMRYEGEPGLINLESANLRRPNVEGTNPCFRGDMQLLTADGYKTFEELCDKQVDIVNYKGNPSKGKVWCSGEKEVFEVKFTNRASIFCTSDHRFMLIDGEECQAISLQGKRIMPYIANNNVFDNAFVKLGFIQGDGTITDVINPTKKGMSVNIGKKDEDVANLFEVDYCEDVRGYYVRGYNLEVERLGFSLKTLPERTMPSTINDWNISQTTSFLRGCYSANGSVISNGRITYKTTCSDFANQLLSVLQKLGINAYITTNKSKDVEFSNGTYTCKESYDVNIQGYASRVKFAELIGFVQEYKTSKLKDLLIKTSPYVVSVKSTGRTEKVYDFTEPEFHWGVVEGVVAHNCGEILLDDKGVCNLTTIDCTKFVTEGGKLDLDEIADAQKKSVRIGIRMLLPDLELSDWNETHKRDMLTGCSMTGFQDMCDMVGLNMDEQQFVLELLREASHREAQEYCKELRIPFPTLITTVKPEGTLSLVAGGVSPGIHVAHSEYFIRRIRISANTALAKAVLKMGWVVKPEVGFTELETAPTWVVEFPIKSGAKTVKADLTIEQQFEIYKMFQQYYTDHNTSNTMTVRGDEWVKLADLILKNWTDYVGVSFLSYDDNTYPLMPYEEITEEEYLKRKEEMSAFNMATLDMFDMEEYLEEELEEGDCKTGGCAIR